jgi:DNA helicase-2/ATP-dependent DNA helicase PcrA
VQNFEFLGGMGSARINATSQQDRPSTGARVSGNFTNQRSRALPSITVVPSDFKVSSEAEIVAGVNVLHLKFGEGKIISVEGAKDNKVATIQFKNDEMAERRIVLKFAKLMVV